MNAAILETIKKSAAVPSIPQVVTRFLEIMRDPEFEYKDLVKVLAADAGTVSEILRLANSALFGVRSKVASLRQALTLLGPKRTRSLLLGRYLVDTMSQQQTGSIDMGYFWRRSLASSVLASRFAQMLLPKRQDEAFISALLADIGIPILAEAMPERFEPIAAQYAPLGKPFSPEREYELVQATHAEVSAMVLTHWTLPGDVARAVNLHQSLSPGEDEVAQIARILNTSDRIAKLLCEIPVREAVAGVCIEATAFIGIDVGALHSLLPTVETDIEEMADVLRIDVIPSSVYALIAKTIQETIGEPAAC